MGSGNRSLKDRIFDRSTSKFWVLVAMMAVSTAAIFIRLSESHPLAIAAWRLLIAEFFLLPFFIFGFRRDRDRMTGMRLLRLGLVGLALALHFGMWIWSFQFTRVSSSVILVTTHPVFVAIISVYLFKEKLNRWAVAGIAMAFLGSLLVVGGDLSVSGNTLIGNLLALGGALMAGIYILAGSRFRKDLSLPTYAFLVYIWAALFLLVAILIGGVELFVEAPGEYALFLALALGPMLAGHTLYNWALRYVSPTLVSVSLLGEPVGSSILAWLILSEYPGAGAVLGGPIVLLGIYFVAKNTHS